MEWQIGILRDIHIYKFYGQGKPDIELENILNIKIFNGAILNEFSTTFLYTKWMDRFSCALRN